jgi:anti-anti-sigma factor
VVVDLRGVTMLDSAGLGRLVSRTGARARRLALVLVRGGRVVARVLQTTRLDEHLEVTREPAAAVRDTV